MDSEESKRMRWVKSARKKGIPYFEEPAQLKAFPILSIKSTPIGTLEHPSDERREKDEKLIESFGSRWKDSFQWDQVSREVEQARSRVMARDLNPRERTLIWREVLESELAGMIQERTGSKVERLIRWAHQEEWKKVIVKNLAESRKRDQNYDFKLATLVYYDEEIDEEKRERRWGTLYPSSENMSINYCNS
jgi:hypothetical protein